MRHTVNAGRVALAAFAVAITAALALPPSGAAAQSITGTVEDGETGHAIKGVELSLRRSGDTLGAVVLTDSDGRFTLRPPAPGSWTLTARRIGFGTVTSEVIEIQAYERLVLAVILTAEAVQLEPVIVTSRRTIYRPAVQQFYDRSDNAGRSGIGQFITREEIERLSPQRPTDLLRTARGVRIVTARPGQGAGIRMGGGCVPAMYVDGVPINRTRRTDSLDDFVTVLNIEGVEVYRGPSTQLGHIYDPSGCGLVLVWTRGGHGGDAPETQNRWHKLALTLALFGLALMVTR